MTSPSYPIIEYKPSSWFFVIPPGQTDATVNWKGVKGGECVDVFAFDSEGMQWRVAYEYDVASFTVWRKVLNVSIPATRKFQRLGPMPVSEMARVLCRIVDNDPDDLFCQWLTIPQLKWRFRRAKAPAALIFLADDLGSQEFEAKLRAEDLGVK